MKIRTGFVSNSSSSSFICEVTGRIESGYDMGLEEAEMLECVNEHVFTETRIIGEVKDKDEDDEDYYSEWRYEVPAVNCPICTLNHIKNNDLLKWLLKMEGIDKEMVINQIKSRHTNYGEFIEAMK